MKAASGTSLLLILLFCFEKSLADTCAARDPLFESCEKLNNRRQDQAKNDHAFHQQSLERESRTVNVRERVGTERLVNNRRIVDSDSRLSNYPSRSSTDRSANRILSSTSEFNNLRVFRIREDRMDQRVNAGRDSRVVRATSFTDNRRVAAFDQRLSNFPETRRCNVRITERLSVVRGSRDGFNAVVDRRNSLVTRERVGEDQSTRRTNNRKLSDENAQRTNSRVTTPETRDRRLSDRTFRQRSSNDVLTARDSRSSFTTTADRRQSLIARERLERLADDRKTFDQSPRRSYQLTHGQELRMRRISIDDSHDASLSRDSRHRLTTSANRLSVRQPTRHSDNRRVIDENLRRTSGLTTRKEIRERRISITNSPDASLERNSRGRLTTEAHRRLPFLTHERLKRVSQSQPTRRTDNRRIADEILRRTNGFTSRQETRRISLADSPDASIARDTRNKLPTAVNRRQSFVARESIERTFENESTRHINNLQRTNRLTNREVTRDQRISTGNSGDMSTASDARDTLNASPDRRNLLVARERIERLSEAESKRHLTNRRISDENLRRSNRLASRQEIRERRVFAESRDASTRRDVAHRTRMDELDSRISPSDRSQSSYNERRLIERSETRVNRERDSRRSFSERQLAERRETRINRERDGSRSFAERRDGRVNSKRAVDTNDSRTRNDRSAERRLTKDTERLLTNVDETSRRRIVRDSHLTRDVRLEERQNRESRTIDSHIKDDRTSNQRRVVDDRRLSDRTSRLTKSREAISNTYNRADRIRVITDGGSRISANGRITQRSSSSYEGSSRRLQVDGRRTADERDSRNMNVRITTKTNSRLNDASVRDENNNEQHRITERRQYRQISDDALYKLTDNRTFDFATWSNVITTTLGILLFGHIISTSSDSKKFHQFTSFLNSAKEKVF